MRKGFAVMLVALAVFGGGASVSAASSRDNKDKVSMDSLMALKEYKKALFKVRSLKDPELVNWYRGYIYYGLYEADSVIFYFQKIVRSGKADDDTRLALCEAHLWKKDYRNARRVAQEISQGTYDRSYAELEILEVQARDLKWQKQFEKARALYKEIIASRDAPENQRVRAMVETAEMTAWQKNLDQALREVGEALRKEPRNESALLLKGKILEWQGEYSRAKKIFLDIVKSDANAQEARQHLEQLMWVK